MCLSTAYIHSGGHQEEVMRDVAQMEAKNNSFLLINLFGERIFVQGKIKSLDFVYDHLVVLEKN